VLPLGAQVRLVTGSSEAPDSSQNTMAARRRRAAARILGPVLSHPAGDRPLVTLDGAAGGTQQAVVQPVAQQLPHVAAMVGDPGQPLDHGRHARKGPVVAVEAVGAGTLAQRLVDGGQLGGGQARGVPGGAGAAQRLQPPGTPQRVPAADVLAGHPEGAGDLGLGVAGGKQCAGLHADAFERLAVAQTAGVAAVGGWSHPAMLPAQPRSCHPKERTSLSEADLTGADLTGADLAVANLDRANLTDANLSGADLSGAGLTGATLVGTTVEQAQFSSALVHGVSVWDLKGTPSEQRDLVITPPEVAAITVDNLKVAQFIYLLLENPEIREVIDTVARKAVLILGRFTPERKAILEALRSKLRAYDYAPILFDFDKPSARDLTETVRTLAHLARFVIADLTDPKSLPQELQAVVPDLAVPVVPIIQRGHEPYSMFADLRRKYHWLLAVQAYDDGDSLLADLRSAVIDPAEAKAHELSG
jgi:uncharacterized protein YjbI with pentapeptide repeats